MHTRLYAAARRLSVTMGLLTLSCLLVQPSQAAEPTPIIAARADQRAWSTPLEALGTLRADESVTLSATVTEIVSAVNFSDNERVESGKLLIRLDDSEVQAELRAAQATRAERNNVLQRSTQLESRNLAPRADVEDNRARLQQIDAEIEAIRAQLADYHIRAPFDGVVGFRDISPGALVTPGMDLVTLDKLDTMKLDFSVPAVYLSALRQGLPLIATTASYPEARFEGQVTSLGTRVDPVTRTIAVRASLPNPELRLRPGMLMEVTLEREHRQALVLPEETLIASGNHQYVLTIDEANGNLVQRRQVTLGERRAGVVEITEGLVPGDLVVSHGVQQVREGERVSILGIDDGSIDISELLRRSRDTPPREGA
ncbi:efflux RND transporter periplasmic adaptor subunit [Modicisalibacter luteus]|uniref:Efflux RND transporter periplasmic adaptor subunit n=1 Tax=Modicisalibacter luteus TaxID=453962 RepID=A0ABV7M7T8_9GAMM|nr:efflux RND transporter periplasmic adaptor subunit [Halomonas lutea]GHB12351.1 MexH family multidrug efflux RND transporter periplasmic adaptor subunit [Halomonas lutea]